jgi:hypothetical protein
MPPLLSAEPLYDASRSMKAGVSSARVTFSSVRASGHPTVLNLKLYRDVVCWRRVFVPCLVSYWRDPFFFGTDDEHFISGINSFIIGTLHLGLSWLRDYSFSNIAVLCYSSSKLSTVVYKLKKVENALGEAWSMYEVWAMHTKLQLKDLKGRN